MVKVCSVCSGVYLSLYQATASLVMQNGGFNSAGVPSLAALAKKRRNTGGVEGGKWGITQKGSGCNFLRKLLESFLVQSV